MDKDAILIDIVHRDPRYAREAYDFVFEALDHTLQRRAAGRKHVSGQEIMQSVRELALERFGLLARTVLAHWGIRRTGDFGDVVFNLIDADLLQKTANDSRADFEDLYLFDEAFDRASTEALHTVDL